MDPKNNIDNFGRNITKAILDRYPVINTEWTVVGIPGSIGDGLTLSEYMERYYPYIRINWNWLNTSFSFKSHNETLYFVRTPEHHAKAKSKCKLDPEWFLDPWNRAFLASPWSIDGNRSSGKLYSFATYSKIHPPTDTSSLHRIINISNHVYWDLINNYNNKLLGSLFVTTVDGTTAICINIEMAATLK